MSVILSNNATSRLAAGITASSTSISVTTGDGAKFPTLTAGRWFPLTLIKADGTIEIVRCTAHAANATTFTVVRAQEGTAASAFAAGDRVDLRATKAVFEDIDANATAAGAAANAAQATANAAQATANTGVSEADRANTAISKLGTAASKNVGTAAGNVVEVGGGGWLSRSDSDTYAGGYPANVNASISQIYRRTSVDNGVAANAASIHFAASDTWGRLRVASEAQRAWVQGGIAGGGIGWTAELYHTGNSQLPVGYGQAWRDVTAQRASGVTYTNATGRAIQVFMSGGRQGVPETEFFVNGIFAAGWGGSENDELAVSLIIPAGSTYGYVNSPGFRFRFLELR